MYLSFLSLFFFMPEVGLFSLKKFNDRPTPVTDTNQHHSDAGSYLMTSTGP